MDDDTDHLVMAHPRHVATIENREDTTSLLDTGLGGFIEQAAQLTVTFGAAVAVAHSGTLVVAQAGANPGC